MNAAPSKKVDPFAVAGRMIGNLIPISVMAWAAVEVGPSPVRWALLGWLTVTALVYLGLAAVYYERAKR